MLIHQLYAAAARNNPDKTAFVCGNQAVTYRRLAANAELYARTLLGLGLRPGDRAAFLMGNIPEIIEMYMACSRAGIIAVPVSCYSRPAEIVYALNHCGARLILAGRELAQTARAAQPHIPSLTAIYTVDDPADPWQQAARSAPADAGTEVGPDADAIILYTSGSTDRPKGVTHTQHSMTHCALNRRAALRLEAGHIYFNSGYLCHGAAFSTTLLPIIYAGGAALFLEHFTPEDCLAMLARRRATHAACGPSQLWDMLEHPALTQTDLSALQFFSSGGCEVPLALHLKFQATMGFPLSESIGMTECGAYMTTTGDMRHKPGSMGKPITGVEVCLMDDQGRPVPQGAEGEIIVRSDTMMARYWNDPVNTAKTIIDGRLHTGDLARQDEDGYYFFVGRKKNMLVRDSCNIPPGEVEAVINLHPKVLRSGVAGLPDPRHGRRILAFVMCDPARGPAPTAAELREFAAQRLMEPRLPDQWIFADNLAVNASGKIDRRQLQQMAEQYGRERT